MRKTLAVVIDPVGDQSPGTALGTSSHPRLETLAVEIPAVISDQRLDFDPRVVLEAGIPLPAAASHPRRPKPTSFAELTVLLADDSIDNVFLMQAYLGPIKTEIASDGCEAVDKFMAGQFDVVLMDIQMPKMDGLQATRLIRQWEHRHQKMATPILACTAYASAEEASLEAGCSGHLNKPISQEALFAALGNYVSDTEQPHKR